MLCKLVDEDSNEITAANPLNVTSSIDAATIMLPVDLQGHQLTDAEALPVKLTGSNVAVDTATIANGAALTSEINLDGKKLVGIGFPAAWVDANLTFQVASATGGTFKNVYRGGSELTETEPATKFDGVYIALSDDVIYGLMGAQYIKIRSGTAASAVNQGAACILTLHLAAL